MDFTKSHTVKIGIGHHFCTMIKNVRAEAPHTSKSMPQEFCFLESVLDELEPRSDFLFIKKLQCKIGVVHLFWSNLRDRLDGTCERLCRVNGAPVVLNELQGKGSTCELALQKMQTQL
eukprot:198237-Pelagomonas_calceolata.AAC.2